MCVTAAAHRCSLSPGHVQLSKSNDSGDQSGQVGFSLATSANKSGYVPACIVIDHYLLLSLVIIYYDYFVFIIYQLLLFSTES